MEIPVCASCDEVTREAASSPGPPGRPSGRRCPAGAGGGGGAIVGPEGHPGGSPPVPGAGPPVPGRGQEAVPSPARVGALIAGMSNRRVPILTGLGALYGGFELLQGADGFMTGFAFPEVLQAMVKTSASGDHDKAFAIYAKYLPLIVFEGQPGVGVRKDIFRMRGLIHASTVRKPAADITEPARAQLEDIIRRVLGDVDITQPLQIG